MPDFLHSIKFKILTPVVFILCIGMVLQTLICAESTHRQAADTASENLYSSLQVATSNFENTIKDIERVVAIAGSNTTSSVSVQNYLWAMEEGSGATDQEKVQYGREVYQYLFQLCNFKYYLNGMAVYDLNGNQQSFGIIMDGRELLEQSWVQEFLEGEDETCVSPVHKSLPTNPNYDELVVSLVRKVKKGQSVIGLVMADIYYDALEDFYSFENLSGYQVILTDGGTVIYPQDAGSWEEKTEMLQEIAEAEQEPYFVRDVNGERYLFVTAGTSVLGWNVIGVLKYRDLIPDFRNTLCKMLFGMACIAVLACAAMAGVVFYATNKLTMLTKAVHSVGMERLELDFETAGRDEIDLLYRQIMELLGRIRALIRQIQDVEAEKREIEIVALQEQINPHFLYNTLNIISMLASFRGMKNIQDIIAALSDMMHLTLDPVKYITVREEVNYVRNYLKIMEYKYSGKFSAEFQIEEEINDTQIPKMILQPFVENSLMHGIAPLTRPGKISITARRMDSYLVFVIRDNGAGMRGELRDVLNRPPLAEKNSKKHIGVRNVRDRLYLIYGEKFRFHIASMPDEFTEVELRIPLENLPGSG